MAETYIRQFPSLSADYSIPEDVQYEPESRQWALSRWSDSSFVQMIEGVFSRAEALLLRFFN